MKRFNIFVFITFLLMINLSSIAYGELLDSWEDEEAYKPLPILFLHGFARGSPDSWDDIANYLGQYYQPYRDITPALSDSISYLERINFQDPNGSVDRYDPGEFNPQGNSAGWADKVDIAADNMLEGFHYGSYCNEVILIAHSMGGLAAREYITTGGAANVEKLITLNTPHAGTTLGNIAQDVNKTRALGWKIPVTGWLYSAELAQVDRTLNFFLNVDIDGEAAVDTAVGSVFLTNLNNRIQPNMPDYIVSAHAWAIRNGLLFHPYYPNSRTAIGPLESGDGFVPIDSQEGFDVISNPGEVREVWHYDERQRIRGGHSTALHSPAVAQRILQWIDSERPEVEITGVKVNVEGVEQEAPFEGGVYRINSSSCILEGSVTKEFFPANTTLNITIQREGEGPQAIIDDTVLLPDDSWDPNNPASVVAGFKETINFSLPGTYTVTTKVINPAGIESNQEVIIIEAEFNQPIIEPIGPTPGQTIADRRPTIHARIYSPIADEESPGIDIDLDSIEVRLDGALVSHISDPPEGGPDIIISYTPTGDLDYETHTVTVNASDITGTPASEVSWSFVIAQPELIIEPIYPGQGGRIIDRTPTIQARIHSNISGYIIDLNSTEMRLDGIAVDHTLFPSDIGPEIFISYTLLAELDIGPHAVTVNASDVNGLSTENSWIFTILGDDVTYISIYPQWGHDGYSTSARLYRVIHYNFSMSIEENYARLRNISPCVCILDRSRNWGGSAGQVIGWPHTIGRYNEMWRTIYSFDTSTIPRGEIVSAKIHLVTATGRNSGGGYYSAENDGVKLYLGDWGELVDGVWYNSENLIAFLDSSYFTISPLGREFAISPSVINRIGLTQVMFVTLKEEQAIPPQEVGVEEVMRIADWISVISLELGIIEEE